MDVLGSRILLRPSDLDRSRGFFRDVLGLAIYREFGCCRRPSSAGMNVREEVTACGAGAACMEIVRGMPRRQGRLRRR